MELRAYQLCLVPFLLLFISRLYRYSKLTNHPVKFPPGPKTLPFIGNLHNIPIGRAEYGFAELARKYGPITGLMAGRQPMLVLNTWQAVRDLCDQKGSIYSSRPSLPVVDIVTPGGINIGVNEYGDLWRRQRKVFNDFLAGDRSDKMKPVQDAESTQMVYDMMMSPARYQDHVFRSFGAVILATVFGQRGKMFEPGGKIERFFHAEEAWAHTISPMSAPPIKSFPFLENIPDWMTPWQGWKQRALKVKEMQESLYMGLLRETQERLAQGKGTDCYMAQCLRNQEKESFSDLEWGYIAGFFLEGGAETSASVTCVFILAMAAYPEVLANAQAEVDRVCGTTRLPGKDDAENMPYLRACMSEVLRWRPVIPLGIPHCTSADDTHGSHCIPAGTDIIINVWNIHHDPASYESPSTFNPDRYLGSNAYSSSHQVNANGRRTTYTFGAGRRICPGQRFAENTLMMHFAKMVWAFDIKRTGELPIELGSDWTQGVIAKPKNMNVNFILRDEGRRKIIRQAWVEADRFLQQYED